MNFGKVNKTVPLIAAVIFILLKLSGDIIFLLLGIIDAGTVGLWKVVSSGAIAGAFYYYLFADSAERRLLILETENLGDKFMNDMGKTLLFALGLVIFLIIAPEVVDTGFSAMNIFSLILLDTVSVYSLFFATYTLYILHKWLLIRRHKKTSFYITVATYSIAYLMIYEAVVLVFFEYDQLQMLNNWIIAVNAAFVFLATKKNAWIAMLPRSIKFRYLWLSLLLWVVSLPISIALAAGDSNLYLSMASLMPGSRILLQASMLFMAAYCTRLFFAVLMALPTTGIMERRTSEISSLTYMNRFITDSASKDTSYLMGTVTQLAMHSINAGGVWSEIYEDDGTVSIGASININPQALTAAHENSYLKQMMINTTKPLLVPSIPESRQFSFMENFVPTAQTMIIAPLFEGAKRFGSLVVIDTEEYGFEADDVKILAAFGDNVNLALENSRLLKDSIEKERLRSELVIAKNIQNQLLPQSLPTIPNFSISAFSRPAEEVGGDYYDYVTLADGRLCVVIGDVSGKGMSAAFYMAQLKGVVHSLAHQSSGPADLLKRINKTLFGIMDKQSFITMCCLAIDNKYGQISYARAGHMPLILAGDSKIALQVPKGIGVGLSGERVFDRFIEEETTLLDKGDRCLIFTDGINELRNVGVEEFGTNTLADIVRDADGYSAQQIINKIIETTDNYMNGVPQHDDMTAVAVVFNGIKLGNGQFME